MKWLKNNFSRKALLPSFIGLMISVLVLVLTLNILATVLVITLLTSVLIFSRSFSKGWLFLLGLVLLFPTFQLDSRVNLFELLLFLVAIIGMIKLAITDKKVLKNKLTFPLFLLLLVSSSYLFFALSLGLLVKDAIWKITLNMILIWSLLIGFQYFFQTQKRIRRFFKLIIGISTAHAVFGIMAFLNNWQTSMGMGVSSGKTKHLIFGETNHQINGFLGIGLQDQIGANPLASFLVIGILINLGFLILNKQQESSLTKKKVGRKKKIRLLDGVYRSQKIKEVKKKFKTCKLFRKKFWLSILILIQISGLFLTFSYSSLIFLGVGAILMGILTKRKRVITLTTIYLMLFAVIFPSIHSSIEIVSRENLEHWFRGLNSLDQNWFFGESIAFKKQGFNFSEKYQGNSYLLFWRTYGIIGLLVFLKILWSYFVDIYKKYESTQKSRRIWFIIVVSCFTTTLLEALTGNVLIFGPTAVIFWLMYGVILNLGKDHINNRLKKINFI